MRYFFATLLAGAVCALGACGGSSPTAPGPGANTPLTITILGQRGSQSFSPNPASAGGRVVVFKNNDTIVHRVRLNDGAVDTGDIAPGATSRSVTMPEAGTHYHCSLHTTMIGSVSPASGGAPPSCEGPYC